MATACPYDFFFAHHKLCWVPRKANKKVSLTLAVEMPNTKFTLYKKKTFAHLGAYFRPGAWPQRARMIFLSASQIMLGSKEATKKVSLTLAVEMPNLKFTLYKKDFCPSGAYFRPGAWPQRARMIFLPHHKLCWVPRKPQKSFPHVGGRNVQYKIHFV